MFDPEEDDKLVWDILWVFLEEGLQDIHWVLCFFCSCCAFGYRKLVLGGN